MSIISCARCHVTVEDDGRDRVDWLTGEPHDCGANMLSFMDSLAEEALTGDPHGLRLLPLAVDAWLAVRR